MKRPTQPDINDQIAHVRSEMERILSTARAELEEAVQVVAFKRRALAEVEVSLRRLTGRAVAAQRPRHTLPSEGGVGRSPRLADGPSVSTPQ